MRRIAAALTISVVRSAVRCGADARSLWRAAGIEAPPGPHERIGDDAHLRVWAAAMRATDEPALPILYADAVSIDDYGLLGLACKTASDLREALVRSARYVAVVADAVRYELHDDGERVILVVDRMGAEGLGHRAAVESILAELTTAIRQIAPGARAVVAVQHRHPVPSTATAHMRFYDCDLSFGCERDALVLDGSALDAPLAGSDRALSTYLLAQLEAEAPERGWRGRVAREVERRLPSGMPDLDAVARVLGVSSRTLQRHLRTEGTSLTRLSREVRQRLAEDLLRRTSHSLAEVAFLLGFSEPSAFHRAFKGWTGSTPAAYRAAR